MSPTQNNNNKIELLVERILIPKIINSNNGSVHESVGQYYMHYKKVSYMQIKYSPNLNYVLIECIVYTVYSCFIVLEN